MINSKKICCPVRGLLQSALNTLKILEMFEIIEHRHESNDALELERGRIREQHIMASLHGQLRLGLVALDAQAAPRAERLDAVLERPALRRAEVNEVVLGPV